MAPRVVFTAGLLALVAAGSCAAQTLNVGSKRFTESYILGEIIKQTARVGRRGQGRASAGTRQHVDRAECAYDGRDRCLSRVHGHDREGDPEARPGAAAGRAQREAGADGPGRRRPARVQQHVRACAAWRRCAHAEAHDAFRSQGTSGSEARTDAGIPRSRRWLARLEARLRAAVRNAARARSRHRLRGDRRTTGRCDRHLFDRREARQARARRAGRRSQLLPSLRRGAAVPGRPSDAMAEDLGCVEKTRGAHRRRDDAAHERRRGTGQAGVRRGRAGLPRPATRHRDPGRGTRQLLVEAFRSGLRAA